LQGQGRISGRDGFLDDVKVECSECHGRRYTDDVLALTWKG
jgi:excinuclease UvrABC ATPase subunit